MSLAKEIAEAFEALEIVKQQSLEIEALKERIAYLESQVYGGSTK
jgi:hypothetical protein